MRTIVFALLVAFSANAGVVPKAPPAAPAASAPVRSDFESFSNVDELKMQKRFGIGLSAAGPLAVMGIEADVNFTADFSISGGLGTGLDYSTFMVKGRYFLPGSWVSPYVAAGVARWWTDGTKETSVGPSVLRNKFLDAGYDATNGFDVWILYPALGVQWMLPVGAAFFIEAQYLFRAFTFSSGTYAGAGMHWYF